jgi:hypothetical protein
MLFGGQNGELDKKYVNIDKKYEKPATAEFGDAV